MISIFAIAAFLLMICVILLTYSLMMQAKTRASTSPQSQQTSIATPTQDISQAATPLVTPTLSHTPQVTPTLGNGVSATPTLVPSTPQTVQTGVFPLSSGGPPPVSASILHPTNIARTLLNGTLVSIYAGSLAADPQQGVLCILRENLTTGQFNIQLYQSPRRGGPLTIVAIHNTTLNIADSQARGTFDLTTNQFQW
jgi:hypothetical protein